jgi:CRISPR-associated endonuclease/helicase Cas3
LGRPRDGGHRRSVGLPDAAVQALVLGASLHDEGKKAPRWQRAFKAPRDAEKHKLSLPLAKTRGPIDQAVLGGYRHELGSLLLLEADDAPRNPDTDLRRKIESFRALPEAWRDLVLHLDRRAPRAGAAPDRDARLRGCPAVVAGGARP